MDALRTLTNAGLHLRADGNRLIVAPADRLTDPLRALIRQHKRELMEAAARGSDLDTRVVCTACAHYRAAAHRCLNHRAALLWSADVGPQLAALPQNCPGYRVRR